MVREQLWAFLVEIKEIGILLLILILKLLMFLKGVDVGDKANENKNVLITNSDFLNNLPPKQAITKAIEALEKSKKGIGKTTYRLRDAVFSRQRYWGEPFPVYYKDETAYILDDNKHVILPKIDKYLPTSSGEPPLARAKKGLECV